MARITVLTEDRSEAVAVADLAETIRQQLPDYEVTAEHRQPAPNAADLIADLADVFHVVVQVPWETLGGIAAGVMLESVRDWIVARVVGGDNSKSPELRSYGDGYEIEIVGPEGQHLRLVTHSPSFEASRVETEPDKGGFASWSQQWWPVPRADDSGEQ